MKRWNLRIIITVVLAFSLFFSVSCVGSSLPPAYYDAGGGDLTATGTQFLNTILFRFDTSVSGHTLTTPSAADIISAMTSPTVGNVLLFAISADGSNTVTILGGSNVTVKPGAATVMGNTTLTIYCELDNVSSGSQRVTIY